MKQYPKSYNSQRVAAKRYYLLRASQLIAIRDTRLADHVYFDSWLTRQVIFPQKFVITFCDRLVGKKPPQNYRTLLFKAQLRLNTWFHIFPNDIYVKVTSEVGSSCSDCQPKRQRQYTTFFCVSFLDFPIFRAANYINIYKLRGI